MRDWRSETGTYLPRIEAVSRLFESPPPHPANIPRGPLDYEPTEIQGVLHRALTFFQIGIWLRERETAKAIQLLWVNGLLASAAPLIRLSFELWGAAAYARDAIPQYETSQNLHRFRTTIDRLFEGVRAEVLLPWGLPASEKPIHVLDTVRALKVTFPDAETAYEHLCESAHANQPRFFEWWILGALGDNWSNDTAWRRGHELIGRTVSHYERSAKGVVDAVYEGVTKCGPMY